MVFFLRKVRIPILLLFAAALFHACDPNRFHEENKELKGSIWSRKDKATFPVMIDDILARYDFYITLRNRGDYPFSNIYLFLKTEFPDGRVAMDTIECRLADPDGKWLGSGISDVKYNCFLFQKGVKFPVKGKYFFEIEQAMRVADLKGISDIGIRLEKQ